MHTIGVYKNNEYIYVKNRKAYGDEKIVTKTKDENKEKILDDFRLSESGAVYYKPVSEKELTDIYRYYFLVEYDAHLIKSPRKKDFISGDTWCDEITSETLLIALTNDYGDEGWDCIDRDTYIKRVKYSEMIGARLRLVYHRKDGIECNPPVVIDKEIRPEEIYKYYEYYNEL